VLGELLVGAVEGRVVEVGLEHPFAEVIDDQAARGAAQEGEGGQAALQPARVVEAHDDADEQIPPVGGHQREHPEPMARPGRVGPPAQVAEVDLGLKPGRGILPQDSERRLPIAVGPGVLEVALEA
jgi:hypothetical protein